MIPTYLVLSIYLQYGSLDSYISSDKSLGHNPVSIQKVMCTNADQFHNKHNDLLMLIAGKGPL